MKPALWTFCAIVVAGCSAHDDRADVLVSTAPPGAACSLSRLGQTIASVDRTPGIALVSKTADDITIVCTRNGFDQGGTVLRARDVGPDFDDIVHARSGYAYDDRVNITLEPRSAAAPP